MKIMILSSGKYGSAIAEKIIEYGESFDIVDVYHLPNDIESLEDISKIIPDEVKQADLLISVGLVGDLNKTIPKISKIANVKSVISPIYAPDQIPTDLQDSIKTELGDVKIVFPKPFCSLINQGDEYIDEFVKVFGKPEVKIEFDDKVNKVEVIRGSPCGATWFVAENLVGLPIEKAEYEAGNRLHNHTCLASMEEDPLIGDSMLHLARYNSKESIKKGLGFTFKSSVVDKDFCEGDEDCNHLCRDVCPMGKIGVNTITLDKTNKAEINPLTCGVCELCIEECPYGAIEVHEGKLVLDDET